MEIDDQGNPIENDGKGGRKKGNHDELVEEGDDDDNNLEDKSEQTKKAK